MEILRLKNIIAFCETHFSRWGPAAVAVGAAYVVSQLVAMDGFEMRLMILMTMDS